MSRKVFCPHESCRNETSIELGSQPVPVVCEVCRDSFSVYIEREGTIHCLQGASLQTSEYQLEGLWISRARWPASLEVLSYDSPSISTSTYDDAPLWFIHHDGMTEELTASHRLNELYKEHKKAFDVPYSAGILPQRIFEMLGRAIDVSSEPPTEKKPWWQLW